MGVFRDISSIAQRRNCTLVLVFRRPRELHGKRRLAASLGERISVQFGRLMLNCALEDLRAWGGPVVLAPEDGGDLSWARTLSATGAGSRRRAGILAQGPGNLGRRLGRLDRDLRGRNIGPRIYIGSDAPALRPDNYRRVHGGLCSHDAVLAVARDGGVTMMATRKGWPALAGLPWGAPRLAHALNAACRKAGHRVLRFPGGFDVDRYADLARLRRALQGDRRPARRELLRWLAREGLA